MTVITEIDDVEICKNCGHKCHCDSPFCEACDTDDYYDEDTCMKCEHG